MAWTNRQPDSNEVERYITRMVREHRANKEHARQRRIIRAKKGGRA